MKRLIKLFTAIVFIFIFSFNFVFTSVNSEELEPKVFINSFSTSQGYQDYVSVQYKSFENISSFELELFYVLGNCIFARFVPI